MTTMRGFWLQLIMSTVMFFSFVGSVSAYADFRVQCHIEHADVGADSAEPDHCATAAGDDHHCAHKSVHCCSSIVLIKGEALHFTFGNMLAAGFGEAIRQMKPSRSLEGPFQPPRT